MKAKFASSESRPAIAEHNSCVGLEPKQKNVHLPRRVHPTNDYVEFPLTEIEQSIAQRFEKQVALHRNRLAVRTSRHDLDYDALNRAANRLARCITEMTNERVGAVALLMEHDAPLIGAILAVLKSGNFYVPLDPSHPPARLRSILEDCQAGLLVTDSKNLPLAPEIVPPACAVFNADTVDAHRSDEDLGREIPSSSLAYILYTSGSTGEAKGVCQNQRNVLHHTRKYTNACHLCAEDHFSLLTSCSHSASVSNLFGALLNGAALMPFKVREEGVAHLRRWLQEQEISVYHSVPLIFRNLAADAVNHQGSFPKLRLIKLGGDAITRNEVQLFKEHFAEHSLLYVGLGATEMNCIRYWFMDKESDFTGHIAPVGYAAEDTEVLLLDEEQKEVAPGEIGEIAIRSRYLFPGYWQRPELTEAAFLPDPSGSGAQIFHTGDLGRFLSDGMLLHLGRKGFQIKIRGTRVEPAEVECALRAHPYIGECVAMAREDQTGEKILVAYLVGKTEHKPEALVLRAQLAEKLPEFMIPSRFVWLDQLPMTNGKVDREALKKIDGKVFAPEAAYVAPSSELERKLVEIWQRVLHRDRVGTRDNFFELGGHSLLAARLVAEIDNLLGRKLPVAALFQSPTIEFLGLRLADENWKPLWSSLVPLQPLGSKPALFFVHGWGGNVYGFLELAKLLGRDQPTYGLQAVGLDGKAPRHTSVEEMAAHYVKEIRSFQEEGPYHLAGFSLGGLIAFEMAQQLYRLGERVAFLGLLDTGARGVPWAIYWRTLAPFLWQRFRFHLRQWWEMPNRNRFDYLRRRWAAVRWWIARNRPKPAVVTTSAGQAGQPAPQTPEFQDYYRTVASAYQPRRYPGVIDIFLSDSAHPALFPLWGNLARGGARPQRVPGKHPDIIAPKNLPSLTVVLKAALERAQREVVC